MVLPSLAQSSANLTNLTDSEVAVCADWTNSSGAFVLLFVGQVVPNYVIQNGDGLH